MILITRPEAEARKLREMLEARGHATLTAPMLNIVSLSASEPPSCRSVLLTSPRASHALRHMKPVPAFAVGEGAAEAFIAAGFQEITQAETLEALLPLLQSAPAPVFYPRGRHAAHNVSALLAPHGIEVRERVVYEAEAAREFPPALLEALARGEITIATFLSARTAEIFVNLARAEDCRAAIAVAFSEAVAGPLQRLPWRSIHVCPRPVLSALAETVDKIAHKP